MPVRMAGITTIGSRLCSKYTVIPKVVATTLARITQLYPLPLSPSSIYNLSLVRQQSSPFQQQVQYRCLSFSFAGPRTLNEIIKKEMMEDKSSTEISDIWYSYHEIKADAVGTVLKGSDGMSVVSRAEKCPFFVQPVFREDGFFMMISQFQGPIHFLMAYLEDYKMDPHSATPLLTFSIFNDYVDDKDLTLVRGDILNKNLEVDEARKVIQSVIDNYRHNEGYDSVKVFNERPNDFDIDAYVSRMNKRWKEEPDEIIDAH